MAKKNGRYTKPKRVQQLPDWFTGLYSTHSELLVALAQIETAEVRGMDALVTYRRAVELLDAFAVDLVDEARAELLSWSQIGAALGMSRQGAHKKFAHQL